MAERSVSQGQTPMTVSRLSGISGSATTAASGNFGAARAKSRVRGVGSLMGAARGSSLMSNDADEGGRFIRSGPDGMGGATTLSPFLRLLPWSSVCLVFAISVCMT